MRAVVVGVLAVLVLTSGCVGGAEGGDDRLGSGTSFDQIASTYDLVNKIISLGFDRQWRRNAIGALNIGATDRVLDVATGTADVAIEMAQMYPNLTVVGVDPSEEMLRIGRAKAQKQGVHSRLDLRLGVAEDLTGWPDASFDAAIAAFGVRNFADREKGLAEVARVLKPDAKFSILEITGDDQGAIAVLGAVRRAFISMLMPIVGQVISGDRDMYRYLHESSARFPSADKFRDLLASCGLLTTYERNLAPFQLGPRLVVVEKKGAAAG